MSHAASSLPATPRYGRILPYRAAARAHKRELDLDRAFALCAVAFVTFLAGVIRFTDLRHLGLRVDEGYTLLYINQPWRGVLGLDGAYEAHPPLFYTLAKLASLAVDKEIAPRAVSALLGVLTIPLFFTMTARLLNARAAAAACLLLAVAPTHVEFSRDGRAYSSVTFVVLLSYVVLIEFVREPRLRWAVIYSLTLAIACYLDYSAAYALVPQAGLLLVALARHGKRGLPLIAAVLVAALAYAPWLPELNATIDALAKTNEESGRGDYLGVSWQAIKGSIPYVLGLDGRGSSPTGYENVWNRWREARPFLLTGVLGVGFVGLVLMRRRPLALLVSVSLAIGVPLTAIGVSQISPGYASRTIQMALIGWCLAVGWLIARLVESRRLLAVGGAVAISAALITCSALTMPATLSSEGRYDWRVISRTLDEYRYLGKPVIAASTAGMLTDVLELYGGLDLANQRVITVTDGKREAWYIADRWLPRGPTRDEVKDGALDALLPAEDPSVDAVWYVSRMGKSTVGKALTKMGYHEIFQIPYRGAILWLYARPGADLGEVIANNGDFIIGGDHPAGWSVSGTFRVEEDPTGGRRLVLPDDGEVQAATQRVIGASAGIYTVTIDATAKKPALLDASLHCLGADGSELDAARQDATFASREKPTTLMFGVLCPEGTTSVRVIIQRGGSGDLSLDKVTLAVVQPRSG